MQIISHKKGRDGFGDSISSDLQKIINIPAKELEIFSEEIDMILRWYLRYTSPGGYLKYMPSIVPCYTGCTVGILS